MRFSPDLDHIRELEALQLLGGLMAELALHDLTPLSACAEIYYADGDHVREGPIAAPFGITTKVGSTPAAKH